METIEKVERLRERANVTYEEAKEALDMANGDLLDAMVILERQGKVPQPGQGSFSTEYDEQRDYIRVRDKVDEAEKSAPSFGHTVRRLVRTAINFIRKTVFIATREDTTIFTVPTIVFVLILFFCWEAVVPIMIFALFFGVRYSFDGSDDTKQANSILNKAGDFAEEVKNEFKNPDDNSGEM